MPDNSNHIFAALQAILYPVAWIASIVIGYQLGRVTSSYNAKYRQAKTVALCVALAACFVVIWIDIFGPLIARLI